MILISTTKITSHKWGKVFKNGLSKICGRKPLKNFTWSIPEYIATYKR